LVDAIKETVASPDVHAILSKDGRSAQFLDANAYEALIKANLQKYAEASKLAHIAPR
jgi:tripartite-type tricarboxylate transporter receptor subunit TctC